MMVKLLCTSHNHDLANTLVVYSYVGRLTTNDKFMLVDMTKTSMKSRDIFLTIKEHNDKNVTTVKQTYNVMIMYRRSKRNHKIEM